MPFEWQEHRGIPVLYVDFRGVQIEEQVALVEAIDRVLLDRGEPGTRILTNVQGVAWSSRTLATLKHSSATVTGPLGTVEAIVGIDGLKRAILRGYNAVGRGSLVWPFRTEAEALEFLTSGRTRPGRS